jgi:hypothetical protein
MIIGKRLQRANGIEPYIVDTPASMADDNVIAVTETFVRRYMSMKPHGVNDIQH